MRHETPTEEDIAEAHEFNDDLKPLSEIEPIEEGGLTPQNREDLKMWVEAPLLDACQQFYDKGITTVFSSANQKDISNGYAHIALDFDSLSPRNQEIALRLGEEGKIHGSKPSRGVYLKIPVHSKTTAGDIKKAALEMVQQFEQQ